jgi:3-hydroxyisobutyrate dehydrogenase-like beta-hydroxyacid dehydrogenase
MAQGPAAERLAVVGLGNMGSALAQALLESDFQVAVSKRTLAKGERFKEMGAVVSESVAEAAAAADLMIVSRFRPRKRRLSGHERA